MQKALEKIVPEKPEKPEKMSAITAPKFAMLTVPIRNAPLVLSVLAWTRPEPGLDGFLLKQLLRCLNHSVELLATILAQKVFIGHRQDAF